MFSCRNGGVMVEPETASETGRKRGLARIDNTVSESSHIVIDDNDDCEVFEDD